MFFYLLLLSMLALVLLFALMESVIARVCWYIVWRHGIDTHTHTSTYALTSATVCCLKSNQNQTDYLLLVSPFCCHGRAAWIVTGISTRIQPNNFSRPGRFICQITGKLSALHLFCEQAGRKLCFLTLHSSSSTRQQLPKWTVRKRSVTQWYNYCSERCF